MTPELIVGIVALALLAWIAAALLASWVTEDALVERAIRRRAAAALFVSTPLGWWASGAWWSLVALVGWLWLVQEYVTRAVPQERTP